MLLKQGKQTISNENNTIQNPGLEITAGQQTMSGQNRALSGQIRGWLDMLSGHLRLNQRKFNFEALTVMMEFIQSYHVPEKDINWKDFCLRKIWEIFLLYVSRDYKLATAVRVVKCSCTLRFAKNNPHSIWCPQERNLRSCPLSPPPKKTPDRRLTRAKKRPRVTV